MLTPCSNIQAVHQLCKLVVKTFVKVNRVADPISNELMHEESFDVLMELMNEPVRCFRI